MAPQQRRLDYGNKTRARNSSIVTNPNNRPMQRNTNTLSKIFLLII